MKVLLTNKKFYFLFSEPRYINKSILLELY